MNPVIHCQAMELLTLVDDPMQAHLFLERSHLPCDVQDLIFNAMAAMKTLDTELVGLIIEHYACPSSFDDKLRH